jgi:WD40 repeat protein
MMTFALSGVWAQSPDGVTAQTPEVRATRLAWSPNGDRVAVTKSTGAVEIFDAATGQSVLLLEGHPDGVGMLAWSPDGSKLATGGRDVRIWNPLNGELFATLDGNGDDITGLAWTPNGTKIISSKFFSGLQIWDVATLQLLNRIISGETYSFALSPSGNRVAKAQILGVGIRDLSTASGVLLEGHEGEVLSVDWSPDGSKVVSGGTDGTVRIWDADAYQELFVLRGHTNFVETVDWSPDGSRIASGSFDGTTRIWDANTGELLEVLDTNSALVAWSPDGTQIAHGGPNATIKIVSIAPPGILPFPPDSESENNIWGATAYSPPSWPSTLSRRITWQPSPISQGPRALSVRSQLSTVAAPSS